jgi:dipeptidyl-peptidase-4
MPDGTSNYDSQANQNIREEPEGPSAARSRHDGRQRPAEQHLLVVDALIKANKDFDLLMIPNVAHGYGAASQYMTRRRWDYFVRYLAGASRRTSTR